MVVRIAPVVHVVGEEIHAHAQPLRPRELRHIGHLTVLQRMTVIHARMALKQCFDRVEHDFGCFIAIRVDMQLQTCRMKRHERLDQLRWRDQP